jgi:hypothetical protein
MQKSMQCYLGPAPTAVVDMNSLDLTTTSVEQHMQQQQHKQSNERM